MSPGKFVLTLTAAICLAGGCSTPQAAVRRPPNVIVILVDDMGWEDAGFMGSSYYKTPRIDALSRTGTVFMNAYSAAPNCAPARAALLSGQAAGRTKIYTVSPAARGPARARRLIPVDNVDDLASDFVTLGEAFQAAGYVTGSFGKWHLGEGRLGPQGQGFDVNIGGDKRGNVGSGGFFAPYGGKKAPPGLEKAPAGEYLIDRLTQETINFIYENKDRPFFAYLSHYAVHTPLEARSEDIAKFDGVPEEQRQGDPRYAAMVESVDTGVGRILDRLEELGLGQDTIIIFTSDNGGYLGATWMPSLRGGKGELYEGGIKVPMIVAWPGHVPAGHSVDTPISGIDLYPTLLKLAGVSRPNGYSLDGNDLSQAVKCGCDIEAMPIFWHVPAYLEAAGQYRKKGVRTPKGFRLTPSSAVRIGKWKLIRNYELARVELFDLSVDPGEHHNLASREPGVVKQLSNALDEWLGRTGADMPKGPNPDYARGAVPIEP